MLNIAITKAEKRKDKPNTDGLGFGNVFTDHMFMMNYTEGKGWHDARIVPYQPIALEPSAMVFHYGQEMFEGLKAYRSPEGEVLLFRPEMNAERVNQTNDRICMPQLPVEDFVQAIKEVVRIDQDWIPIGEGNSLYIRPFIIATDPFLGVRASETYLFMIILSPVGAYYKEGINPVKIWVENEYVRAVKGGIGFAKTGGNYVASLKAQVNAKKNGYTQVLWLDGIERKYVEEVGTMNVFFKINGKIYTPAINGSILPGVTRNSTIELLRTWNYEVFEERISIDELMKAAAEGTLEEAFGTGTAAVISPIGELAYDDKVVVINNNQIGEVSRKVYDVLTGIQTGKLKDDFHWTVTV
ncbi:MAG: branched-chain amino acid aminotransferase [Vallitaleaceae bacterium]|nr:branched-chain amino acid aminotransferase [Vallitaleaceae bacterium]